MPLTRLILCGWLLLAAATTIAEDPSNYRLPENVVKVGKIANQKIIELSGLACSPQNAEVLWAINDGGSQPLLFAVGIDGADLGSVSVVGAHNRDWEDIASFIQENTSYILIADVGDNSGSRKFSHIYIIVEPKITGTRLKKNAKAKTVVRIRFTYEDGPRDCEAVAVNIKSKKILLLTKRTRPVMLYELPLDLGTRESSEVARRIHTVKGVGMPSAMDISPQENQAAVLSYNQAYLFKRRNGENWPIAFSRPPRALRFPVLRQQEAICFSNDGQSVYISSEGRSAPLLRIDLFEKNSSL
jgi:hypothetical protein